MTKQTHQSTFFNDAFIAYLYMREMSRMTKWSPQATYFNDVFTAYLCIIFVCDRLSSIAWVNVFFNGARITYFCMGMTPTNALQRNIQGLSLYDFYVHKTVPKPPNRYLLLFGIVFCSRFSVIDYLKKQLFKNVLHKSFTPITLTIIIVLQLSNLICF